MHVNLTDTLDQYVKTKVAGGLYNNASEVVREALRGQIAHEQSEEAKLAVLKAKIDEAWEETEQGLVVDYDFDVFSAEADAQLNA